MPEFFESLKKNGQNLPNFPKFNKIRPNIPNNFFIVQHLK